jgi:anti-anti-sigma regulatory factor/anti-sigma regulatory factor (Ser/Thr protein kinase)
MGEHISGNGLGGTDKRSFPAVERSIFGTEESRRRRQEVTLMGKKTSISNQRMSLRQKKTERLRKKSAGKKRLRNIQNNNRQISFHEEKSQRTPCVSPKPRDTYVYGRGLTIKVEPHFSLIEDASNVLSFVNKIDEVIKRKKDKLIIINLSDVVSIDIGAIGLLLSKMNELSQRRISAIGTMPKDTACKTIISGSGFLEHMQDLKGNKIKTKEHQSMMVNRGFDKTSNSMVGAEIRKVLKHLTGEESTYRPIYTMVQEMCPNSIEYANKKNKNWLFSIYYKDTDSVSFTMTDIGHGILDTLKRKATQRISDGLKWKSRVEILNGAFDGEYASATSDINRNKGLPTIKKQSTNNYVNNLIVITNNVFLDFSNKTNSKILNERFKGTFYYWELNKNCIDIWKNRRI